jgi:putative transcriptional regulator
MYIKLYMKESMNLRNRLKEIRIEKNLTQEKLANACEVTRQTILAIEKGKFGPTVTLALVLARVLDVGVEDLFWLESNDPK